MSEENPVVMGLYVPPHPHPLLCPEENDGWKKIRNAYEDAKEKIESSGADLIIVYSTLWPSIVGHQIQAQPEPEWTHVDDDFHFLGSMPYKFKTDTDFSQAYKVACEKRGLTARTVAYHGFPIDTGSIVALKLLNPDNKLKSCIVSSNMYANRSETIVLGKAARDALIEQGKKAVIVIVSSLSNRMFTTHIEPKEDRIHSSKDEEWNNKIMDFFADGRLEDLSQLSRQIHSQIRVQKVVAYKPVWWMAAAMGQHNNYRGIIHGYAPIHGSGAAVISLTPTEGGVGDKEFDEDDVEMYRGDRNVLHVEEKSENSNEQTIKQKDTISTNKAPKPVGAYPHAKKVGDLLYLSGVGPRQPETNDIPGGAIKDEKGNKTNYNIKAQTKACIENVKTILEAAGSKFECIQDVTVFLIDMERDFSDFNEVYSEYFSDVGATRTTIAVTALPTPIAVEMKVVAKSIE